MSKWWHVLREAFASFLDDHGMKLGAALSYYTIFSIGPVLIIVISLAGVFFGKEAVEGRVYEELKAFIGGDAAYQVQIIIRNVEQSQLTTSGAVVGLVMLVVGATGVFTEIQDSINFVWSVRPKPKKGWLKLILNRLISFSLLVSMSFILLVSLAVHALVDLLHESLMHLFGQSTVYILFGVNYVLLFVVITTLFAIIFKVLPDAKIHWFDAFVGAAFTAVLFLVGKFLIGFYITQSNVDVTFGAAASVIVLLIWVYYSSVILYFGAEFTKAYTLRLGHGIVPEKTAVFIVKQEARELDGATGV